MKSLIIVFSLALFFAGCSDSTTSNDMGNGGKTKGNQNAYAALGSNAVLVKVGTNVCTKADVEGMIDIRLRMYSLSMSGGGAPNKNLNRQAVEAQVLSMVQTAYRLQVAQLQWAATNGIDATAAEIAQFQTNFMAACGIRGEGYEKFVMRFSAAERETIAKRIRTEATLAKVKKRYLEMNPVQASEKMVTDYLSELARYNRNAHATNALVWAKGTNLWHQLKKGADFGEVAERDSEEGVFDSDATWGTFRLDDLRDNPELVQVLPKLAVGEITPPIEADNGLCIIRIDEITDLSGAETKISDSMTRYRLSRIYLRLPEIYEVPTREEAIFALNEGLKRKSFSAFVKGLIFGDRATFPSGERIFDEAREMRRMPMMLQQNTITPQNKEG